MTAISDQILNIPNGAGGVGGLGETFAADPYTGTGRFSIPINTPAGHAGLGPSLAVVYSSGAGAGVCGVGWSFGVGSIRRRTSKGIPRYTNDDVFLLGDDELIPLADGWFQRRSEGSFARIRHVQQGREDFWAVTDKSGVRRLYGKSGTDRDGETNRIAAWHLSEIRDTNNNVVTYTWARDDDGKRAYLQEITWGGVYRVQLTYEDRPDLLRNGRAGFLEITDQRLKHVDVQVKKYSNSEYTTFDSYALSYEISDVTELSRLSSVTHTGTDASSNTRTWPTLTLSYADPSDRPEVVEVEGTPARSLADPDLTLIDMDGNSLPDLLESTSSGYLLRRNMGGGRFSTPTPISAPTQRLRDQGVFLSDMAGEGFADIVTPSGYYPNEGAGFGQFRPFTGVIPTDLQSPSTRFVDIDGDGLGDVVVQRDDTLFVYKNVSAGVWDPPLSVRNNPDLPRFSDPSTRFADITGDGLSDLVRVHRGGLEVWANTGHGHFAEMRRVPLPEGLPQGVEPEHIQLADVTGSGAADFIVRRGNEVWIFPNGCGVSFGDKHVIKTRALGQAAAMEVVDLRGTSVKGLLYTETNGQGWTYYALWGDTKPDVLQTVDNGMGAVTTVTYGSSVAHAARDMAQTNRWRFPLPFPIMVVDSVVSVDETTGTRVGQRFRYHHGYYDPKEREFRGFGHVEQIDTETDDVGNESPPSRTVRFFDLGNGIQLRDQWFAFPAPLPDTELPNAPGARRTLRGVVVREEVYGDDGTTHARRPYVLTHNAYRVKLVAGGCDAEHSAFFAAPSVTESVHMERQYDFRRLRREFTYDELGRTVEQREKGFGRRSTYTEAQEQQQEDDLERYTTTSYHLLDDAETDDYDATYSPTYIADRPFIVKTYGVESGGDVLLSQEELYYDGVDYEGLGHPDSATQPGVSLGRLSCKLVLALTDDLLGDVFPSSAGDGDALTNRGDYLKVGSDYYIQTDRVKYTTKGLVEGAKDPRGNVSTFAYETGVFDLFPNAFTDAKDHPTTLTRGELPFQVDSVTDANGNVTDFTYDPSGLPAKKAVKGKYDNTKTSDWDGDTLTNPTEEYVYDFDSTPVHITVKTRHDASTTFDVHRYIDGLGRTIQERHTAEDDPSTAETRFRVTGWQIFNHKGLVVKAYQPEFSGGGGGGNGSSAYAAGSTSSAYVETTYDPLGRPTRVDYPDGTYETTTYHPWIREFRDRNDNAGAIARTDTRYGGATWRGFQHHIDTPTQTYVDAFGREIAVSEDNGSGKEVRQTFRITTYEIGDDATNPFDGDEYTLQLEQPLSPHYFVMVMGCVYQGNPTDADEGGVRISADPHGTGDLDISEAPDQIVLSRTSGEPTLDWKGSVVVWECLGDNEASGFRLVDVRQAAVPAHTTQDEQVYTTTANTPWGSANTDQVVLYGGPRGGGATCDAATSSAGWQAISGGLKRSGDDTITIERYNPETYDLAAATFTVYVVQWGSEHTVHYVEVEGTNGGAGIDVVGEYNAVDITSPASSVTRDETWCWFSGYSEDSGNGDSFWGLALALGDGVTQNATETQVAIGSHHNDNRVCQVVVHSHPSFAIDWRFQGSDNTGTVELDTTVDASLEPESEFYTVMDANVTATAGHRAGVFTPICYGTWGNHCQTVWWPRHTASGTLTASRQWALAYAAWMQSIDTAHVEHTGKAVCDGFGGQTWLDDDGVAECASIRVTTYDIGQGAFSGTSFDLELDQPLVENYFVMVHGTTHATVGAPTAADGGVRVTEDPHGTGDLGDSGAPNVITLERGTNAGSYDWVGEVTVVECVGDPDTSGFELVDVSVLSPGTGSADTEQTTNHTANTAWTDLSQVALYGGPRGGGSTIDFGGSAKYPALCGRLTASGTDAIALERYNIAVPLAPADFTVYVVQWGSEHTIQHVDVGGTAGSVDLDDASDYDTGTISSVNWENSWLWMSGFAEDNGIGDSWHGAVLAPGDGTTPIDEDTKVAVGSAFNDQRDVRVTVHSHDDLVVDWRFSPRTTTAHNYREHAVRAGLGEMAIEDGLQTGVTATMGSQLSQMTTSAEGTGTQYFRVIWSTRHGGLAKIITKRPAAHNYAAWLQSIDFAKVRHERRRLHVTRSVLDLKDQVLEVYDARELSTPTWTFEYDLAGRRLSSNHSTALGVRYALADAAGNPIWARDARDVEVDRTFDELNRPLTEHSDSGGGAVLRRKWSYVDYDTVTDSNNDPYRAKNLFGQVEEERDADGLRWFEYDWRGQVTSVHHKFWNIDWQSGSIWGESWAPTVSETARASLTGLSIPDLKVAGDTLTVTTSYDVAGRPSEVTYPTFYDGTNDVDLGTKTTYNAAGMLESVQAKTGLAGHWDGSGWNDVVTGCEYDYRGKLTKCTHGNGIETTREYDDDLERLTRIFSQYSNGSTTDFQDLNYVYDPVGNPVRITDALQESTYAHNQVIPNTRRFTYDPRYRLIRARGKKLRSIGFGSINPEEASPQDGDYIAYDYRYAYDEVGNFRRNQEFARGPLHYKDDGTGRIDLFNGSGSEALDADPTAGNYVYDSNGNCVEDPRQRAIRYTFDNQPDRIRFADGSVDDNVVFYQRHGDQRVLRLLKKGTTKALGIYLGPFELHSRETSSSVDHTKLVLHVSGPGSRAQVEVVLDGTDSESLDVFFSHTDHLGSGHVLTKDDATLLSQEEYFPYGRASDRRDARNRYRYIGVERDEETGLCMTGPRTYDPVTGRFLSGDPLAVAQRNVSPFVYASASPVMLSDSTGLHPGFDAMAESMADQAAEAASSTATPTVPPPEITSAINEAEQAGIDLGNGFLQDAVDRRDFDFSSGADTPLYNLGYPRWYPRGNKVNIDAGLKGDKPVLLSQVAHESAHVEVLDNLGDANTSALLESIAADFAYERTSNGFSLKGDDLYMGASEAIGSQVGQIVHAQTSAVDNLDRNLRMLADDGDMEAAGRVMGLIEATYNEEVTKRVGGTIPGMAGSTPPISQAGYDAVVEHFFDGDLPTFSELAGPTMQKYGY